MSNYRQTVRTPYGVAPILIALVSLSVITGTNGAAHAAPPQRVDPFAPISVPT